ncbi:hypothetical protein N473_26395 [Pseudoalteromonas luteoviolacea CPMOR-1]|uniref:Uncharacterized protein n=1 Tax=Pseudoalteromonas luteoviolacea CPMOR-1 TaxID=1365248 RepID=A0A167HU67_9GAMM|nr:hypothetical protein [Pseudoalteromonas luteoviolacea]KZN58534.1 hypothetical protein N473_26395 [Pseudoalteromonas luteoviolacea CPMOR-1]
MSDSQGFILRGEVFLTRTNSKGVPLPGTGAVGPINAEQLEIEPDIEEIIRPSRNKATHGKSLGRVQTANPTKLKLKFDEVDSKIIADALAAEHTALNQQAINATDKPIALNSDGTWSSLGAKHITSTNWGVKLGVDDLVDGVDYEVKWAAGLIRPLAGGRVINGGEIKVTYQALALEGSRIKGGEVQEVNWAISLTGVNIDNGDKVQLDVPLAQMSSTSALNFLQNEYMSPEFEGVASIAQGKDYDYLLDVIS